MKKKLKKHYEFVKWMIQDSLWRLKKKTIQVFIADFMGLSLQVSAIGLVLQYVKLLEKNQSIKKFGYEFAPQGSMGLFILFSVGILISLLISSWLIYYSEMHSFKMRVDFDKYCSKRIFLLYITSNQWLLSKTNRYDDKEIIKIATGDSRLYSRVVLMLLNLFKPIITFIVAVPTMLYIDFKLTLLLIVLVGISLFFQYKINKMAANQSVLLEKFNQESGPQRKKLFNFLKNILISNSYEEAIYSVINREYAQGAIQKRYMALEGRLTVTSKSNLVSNILFAIGVFVILTILVSKSILLKPEWTNVIAYLVALRVALTQLSKINRIVTGINRFYPQIYRYYQFVSEPHNIKEKKLTIAENIIINATNPMIMNSQDRIQININERFGLFTKVSVNRISVKTFITMIFKSDYNMMSNFLNSHYLITDYYTVANRELKKILGLPSSIDNTEIIKELNNAGMLDSYKNQISRKISNSINEEIWENVDAVLKTVLTFIGAILSDANLVFIHEKCLRNLPDHLKQYFLNRLADRVICIIYGNRFKKIGEFGEQIFVVIDENEVIGLGDIFWIKKNIENIVNRLMSSKRNLLQDEEDEEDEDDEL